MLEDTPELYKGLTYPWSREVNPTPGQAEQIADGVYWVRFPMPMSLDHINIWLLEDGDGWTVVDTCLNLGSAREIWEQLFSTIMGDRPIRRPMTKPASRLLRRNTRRYRTAPRS